MSSKSFDYLLKYIMIGDASVGKSNLLLRFVYNTFQNEYQITIGVEFGEKNIVCNDKTYQIQIWDTAGQEQFRSITRAYYKNSICALVVYDISRRDSFDNVKQWIDDCKNYMPNNVVVVLVGNKSDLEDRREVTKDEGQEIADSYGLLFYETSAKTGDNVNEVFNASLQEIARRIESNFYNLEDETCGIKVSRNRINKVIKKEDLKKQKEKSGCC